MLAARRMMNLRGCHTSYSDCDTVTDAFNRSDYGDGTLGFADTGQRWTNVPAGPFGMSDGYWTTQGTTVNTAQAQVPVIDHYRAMGTILDAGGNNQDITITGSWHPNDALGVFVRCAAGISNGYYVSFDGGVVFKADNPTHIATFTAVASDTVFTGRVVALDNNLSVFVNGSSVLSLTIDPDDAGGNCETDWTWLGIRQDHGGAGGSAPSTVTVDANTYADNLSVVAP